ncbi:hypothetical protein [Robiginitalea aurantiaca]|nr:hypothetical protein [Robiginitalea aurantiaca]
MKKEMSLFYMKNPMKFLPTLLIAILFSACETGTKAESQPQDEIAAIANPSEIDSVKRLIESSFEGIWSELDTSRIKTFHTEDFILLEAGMVWNNDSIANYLLDEQKRMLEGKYQRLNRFKYVKAVQSPGNIWVAYQNYGTWVQGSDTLGTAQWLESAIAVKENGQWKLQQLHSTPIQR